MMSVRSVSAPKMDNYRFIELVFIFLSYVLLSNQMVLNDVTAYECPFIDITNTTNGKTVHNITRTIKCENGRKMPGCCVDRIYCNYNTSHIDLTMYGPPGFHMPCGIKEVCCPQTYILPIPLYNDDDEESNNNDDDNDK